VTQNTNRVVDILFRYVVDKSSITSALDQQRLIQAALLNNTKATLTQAEATQTLSQALKDTARQQALKGLAAEAQQANLGVDELARKLSSVGASKAEIQGVVAEINRLREASEAAAKAAPRGTRLGRRLRQAGQELYLLPDVGPSTEISRGLRIFGGVVDATKAGLGSIAAAGAIAAPALVLTAIAFKGFIDQLNLQKSALAGALSAQDKYTTSLSTFTSSQAREEAEKERLRIVNLQNQRAVLQAALDSAFAQQSSGLLGDASARAQDLLGFTTSEQLREQLGKLDAQLNETTGYALQLTAGANAGAFALNDLTAALEKQTKAQLEQAHRLQNIEGMTQEQRDERIREIMNTISTNDDLIQSGRLTEEAARQLGNEQGTLLDEFNDLIGVTRTYADQLDLEAKFKQAVIDRSDELNEGLQDLASAQADLAKASEKADETYRALTEAELEHAEKLRLIEADRLDKEQDLKDKAAESEQEQIDKRAEKREEALEDHQKKLREIEERYQDARGDAIGNRDALALLQAEKERAKAKKKEDEDYADKLKKIDQSLEDQQKVIDKRLKEQLKSLEDNARKSIDAENRRYAKEYQDKLAAHQRSLSEEARYLREIEVQRGLNALSRQYWDGKLIDSGNRVDAATAQYAVNLINYANQIANAAAMLPGAGGGSVGLPPPITPGVFGAPSPTTYTQNSAVNFAFSPTIHATTRQQIRREVDQRLGETLRRAVER